MKLKSLTHEEEVAAPTTEAAEVAPVVDISDNPDGGRILKIQLPNFKHMSDADRAALEAEKGSEAIAQCDALGTLIFKAKNVNEVHNGEREEFDGMTYSTTFMKLLADALKASAEQNAE